MRKNILVFALLMAVMTANGQTEKITLAENGLKGRVKDVTITANWMKEMFGEWEPSSLYYSETMEFDKNGMLMESSRQENYDYSKAYTYKYDRKGNLLEKRWIGGKKKEKDESIYKFSLDDKSRVVQLDMTNKKGDLYWRNKMKYHDDGRASETFYYGASGDLYHHAIYDYDEKNRVKSVSYQDPAGEIIKLIDNTYDQESNKTEEITYEKVGKISTRTTYTWTYKQGRKIREKKVAERTGEKLKETTTEFNEWGDVTKVVEWTGTVYTTVYTFDSQNNWITATCTFKGFDGPSAYRITRDIRYY